MTRRTLIATLLAAILAPFRRAKAAPKMLMYLDSEAPRGQLTENLYLFGSEAGPRPLRSFDIHPETWVELSPADQSPFYAFDVDAWRSIPWRNIPLAPTAAKFGLCAKCGGLTCVCD